MGCWATHVNNNYIPNIDDEVGMSSNIIRVDPDSDNDMFHNANSLQESFDYKPMHCYSNHVPLLVLGQPDELEMLTIKGVQISAADPFMVIMHEALRKFPYNLIPEALTEAMQEFKKIMQAASKVHIEKDRIEDPLVQMQTHQDIIAGMCRSICLSLVTSYLD